MKVVEVKEDTNVYGFMGTEQSKYYGKYIRDGNSWTDNAKEFHHKSKVKGYVPFHCDLLFDDPMGYWS